MSTLAQYFDKVRCSIAKHPYFNVVAMSVDDDGKGASEISEDGRRGCLVPNNRIRKPLPGSRQDKIPAAVLPSDWPIRIRVQMCPYKAVVGCKGSQTLVSLSTYMSSLVLIDCEQRFMD